jgi:hypothetical protein
MVRSTEEERVYGETRSGRNLWLLAKAARSSQSLGVEALHGLRHGLAIAADHLVHRQVLFPIRSVDDIPLAVGNTRFDNSASCGSFLVLNYDPALRRQLYLGLTDTPSVLFLAIDIVHRRPRPTQLEVFRKLLPA